MKVIQKIQSTRTSNSATGAPTEVDMKFFEGDSVAEGIAAVASIMASKDDTAWYRTLEIRVEF